MTSMEIVQFLRPPLHPLSINVQNSSNPLTLDVQFQRNPPLMITNQLKENIIQGWLLYVIESFLEVGFRFQYQLINLAWLSFDFFSFSWSLTFYFLVSGFILLCVQLSKISRNVFNLWLFSFLGLILQWTCFISTTWKLKKLWNNNRTVYLKQRN